MKLYKQNYPLRVVNILVVSLCFIDLFVRQLDFSDGIFPREGLGFYIVLSIAILLGALNLGFLFYHMAKAMHEVRKA